MTRADQVKNDEERELSRGGKGTAIAVLTLTVVTLAGGLALAMVLRRHVSPPPRPGSTSATTSAGVVKPPSPSR